MCSWEHRFDDPRREYRTLYSAEGLLTALREVLAPLRPDAVARAEYARYQLDQGIPLDEIAEPTRRLKKSWRAEHVWLPVKLVREGPIVDIDAVGLREELARSHADLLKEHGMDHLDISEIRSTNRPVTQAMGRDLYERDVAGLTFGSNRDNCRCLVIFEGRAELMPTGEPISLLEDIPELTQVAREYGLLLDP